MMSRYIAFLRAINVGGHTVKMESLRTLFASFDLANIETFIASGNVIFDSAEIDAQALEKTIESGLRQALGYDVATFLRSSAELAEIAYYQPFPAAELDTPIHALYIAFVRAAPTSAAQQKLLALRNEINDFQIHKREIYWLCRTRSSESGFSGALLEKTIGMPATLRNATTVKKLAAKYPAP